MSRQVRWWILTVPFYAYTPYLPSQLSYVRGQLELGQNGLLHWQIVAVFKHSVRLSSLRQLFGNYHAEVIISRDDSIAYVHKDETAVVGTRFELGSRPRERSSKRDWEATLESAKSGDFDAIDPGILVF